MRGDELAEKAFQPINSLSLPLSHRFKRSGPVLVIKTNIWGRPRHYWFYPSRLEKPRWEGVLIARFALCDEIKRAERTWNPIPKSKPQAVFHSWQQLLFTQWQTQVESSEENTAPFFFSSLFFSLSMDWTQDKCCTLMLARARAQPATIGENTHSYALLSVSFELWRDLKGLKTCRWYVFQWRSLLTRKNHWKIRWRKRVEKRKKLIYGEGV